ncbi:MAG: DUF4340 domain-containing protein [Phycisphaerae bacterium]
MKAKTAILLAIFLIVAIGFLAIRESDLLPTGEPGESPNGVLFEDPNFAPTAVTVTDSTGDAVTFEKVDGDWRITQPTDADAIDWKVEQLTALLDAVAYDRTIDPTDPEEVSHESAGLAPPLWTLTARTPEGATRTLQVGKPVPRIGSGQPRTYVRPEGWERIFVADRNFAEVLARDVGDYRELKLLSLTPRQVRGVTVSGRESFSLVAVRDDWRLTHGDVTARADSERVSRLLSKLTKLTADAFVAQAQTPSKLAMYGLAEPRLTVQLTVSQTATTQPTDANTTVHTLAMSAPAGDRVFLRLDESDAIYQVDKALLDSLQPDWETLRSMSVLNVRPDDVREVTIRRGKQTTKLTRGEEDAWTMTSPHEGPAATAAVGRLIQDLAELPAREWRDNPTSPATLGLADPDTTVTLRTGATDAPLTLEIGAVDGNDVFVRTIGASSVAVVKQSALKSLRQAPDSLWNRTVMDITPGRRVTSFRVDRLGRDDIPSYTAVRSPRDTWALTAPVAAGADDETIQGILHQVERIQGRRTVALGDIPAKYADANEHLKATFKLAPTADDANAPQPRTVTLHVVRMDGKGYAWREDEKPLAVREVSAGVFIDLAEELRKRDLFGDMGEADLQSVRVARPEGKAITLQRTNGIWSGQVDGNDVAADKALSLVENLLATRAERFIVHKKAPAKAHGLDAPSWQFTLTPSKGEPRTLRIAAEMVDSPAEGYPASIDGVTGVFTLPAWRVDGLADAVERLGQSEQ